MPALKTTTLTQQKEISFLTGTYYKSEVVIFARGWAAWAGTRGHMLSSDKSN